MADQPRSAPVAIRIGRPYRSEEEFLTHEPEALTRTTATLIGAQAKPQGVILRFEVTLSTGEPLLRGEGRVVGFRPETSSAESALTLRFTRLDARSKALVDRAAALRDARGRTSHPPAPAAPPVPEPPSEPTVTAPPPSPKANHHRSSSPRSHAPPLPAARAPRPHAAPSAPSTATAIEPPADRERLLERLRERGRALPQEAVAAILAKPHG